MAVHRIPLALSGTARGWAKSLGTSAKDQKVINGLFEVSVNPLLGTKTVYVTKRSGYSTGTSIAGELDLVGHYSSASAFNPLTFSRTNGTLHGTTSGTSYGSVTETGGFGSVQSIAPNATIGSVDVVAFAASDSNGYTGWFLYSDATSTNFTTFTGNRTSGSAVISGIASTTGIYKGQAISGTGIPASTRVLSVDSASQITMTANATSGAATATTITKAAVAKIIDADFPTTVLAMAFLDGYFFACTADKIYQSALNDPSSWSATDYISADYEGDTISTIFRWQNYIVAAGQNTFQFFYNNGNPTGSVLSAAEQLTIAGIGISGNPINLGGDLYFVGVPAYPPASGTPGAPKRLYRMSGTSLVTVSDDLNSSLINDNPGAVLGTAIIGNKALLKLGSFSTSTMLYDPATEMFSELQLASALRYSFGKYLTVGSSLHTWEVGNTWTDSGSAFTMTVQTEPQIMAGGLDTTDNFVDLIADVESTGTTTLSVTDDDYANWTTVGTFDMTKVKKRIQPGTPHNARAYRLQHSANTGFRAQMLIVNHTPGTT